MGLDIKCDKCGKILNNPGALLFSVPDKKLFCKKYHICSKCYMCMLVFLGMATIEFKDSKEADSE